MTDLSDKLHKVYPFAALSQQISVTITDSFDVNVEIVTGRVWEVQVMKRLPKEKQNYCWQGQDTRNDAN